MSVVGDKVVFCEGKQSSLDFRLINKVIENLSVNKPDINQHPDLIELQNLIASL